MSLIIFKQFVQMDSAVLAIQKIKRFYSKLRLFALFSRLLFCVKTNSQKKVLTDCEYVNFMLKKKFFIHLFFSLQQQYEVARFFFFPIDKKHNPICLIVSLPSLPGSPAYLRHSCSCIFWAPQKSGVCAHR